jgi:hypothetical protein
MDMAAANPSGQSANPGQKNIDEERKKLDSDLKAGKISQAEYFKKMQDLTGGAPANPSSGQPQPGMTPQPQANPMMPGQPNPALPQLPPASGVSPVSPVTPGAPGPREEVPPIGQALAISSEDVEVVECYKCGGLITITTKQRPVIIACPACGTKGEVDASEPDLEAETSATPKATDGVEVDESKMFKFSGESEKPAGPSFGASLSDDLKKDDQKTGSAPGQAQAQPKTPAPTPSPSPAPVPVKTPAPAPAPAPASGEPKPNTSKIVPKKVQ